MNREVNLTKRVKTAQGLRHCPVALSANGPQVRSAILAKLGSLATEDIPATAFESVEAWARYLESLDE